MGKYQVGDKITMRYEVIGINKDRNLYQISENGYLTQDHIDQYAIVPQPAPVDIAERLDSIIELLEDRQEIRGAAGELIRVVDDEEQPAPVADWQPKVGERVLVEGVVIFAEESNSYHVQFQFGPANPLYWLARSAIVGPAPASVRARFKVGDWVFSISSLERCEIIAHLNDGSWMCQFTDTAGTISKERCDDADLIDQDEARKRLAK